MRAAICAMEVQQKLKICSGSLDRRYTIGSIRSLSAILPRLVASPVGQSSCLTDTKWTELTATLAASPSETGYDYPTRTPAIVRESNSEMFDTEYSL